MDDHEIVDLYWQRDEHAIEATAAKYESYCMKISQNILSDRADFSRRIKSAPLPYRNVHSNRDSSRRLPQRTTPHSVICPDPLPAHLSSASRSYTPDV